MEHSGIPLLMNSKFQKVLLGLSVLMIAAGISIVWLTDGGPGLIEEIVVQNNHYLTVAEVKEISGLSPGLYLDNKIRFLAKSRLESQPSIESVDLSMDSRGVVTLSLEGGNCAAVVRTGDSIFDVDENLRVLSTTSVRCLEVPLLAGSFPVKNGVVDDSDLENFMESWQQNKGKFRILFSRISEVRFSNKHEMILYISGSKIRVKIRGPLTEDSFKRLRAALSYFENKEGSAGLIDLRGPDAILLPEL